jgi:hypothetical protein
MQLVRDLDPQLILDQQFFNLVGNLNSFIHLPVV